VWLEFNHAKLCEIDVYMQLLVIFLLLVFVINCVIILLYHFKHEETDHIMESIKIFLATKLNTKEYYTNSNQPVHWVAKTQPIKYSKTPRITWLGHSSFLMQLANFNVLTDPIFTICQ